MMREDPAAGAAGRDAEAIIARQAAEIARLRRQLADERFAAELREVLAVTAVATVAAAPTGEDHLLELILATAMQAIAANAGALFLVDEEQNDLDFRVALGGQASKVKGLRVPLGHGVAGLVAASGQPMIVSNAEEDTRQASDIAAQVNYQPRTILCVPMLFDDRVIGVLELLDKLDAPNFTMADMVTLGRFAEQAAVAIEQSHIQGNLTRLVQGLIASDDAITGAERAGLQRRTADFVAGLTADDAAFRRAVELAAVLWEIVRHGDDEARTCAALLDGFAAYLRARGARDDGG